MIANWFEPKIGLQSLADLSRRLGTSLAAGIDIRKVFHREACGRGGTGLASRMQRVSDCLARGDTLTEALAQTGDYFPPLFRDLAEVGEQTGNLAEIFQHLADHYEHQLQVRRTFMRAILLPCLELGFFLFIIGVFIVVMGILPQRAGQEIDIFGFGLRGVSGLAIYVLFLAVLFGLVVGFIWSMRRGALWTKPIQRLLIRVPVFGGFLRLLALSRMAWTMNLTLNTSLGLHKALPLCLRSTQNVFYEQHIDAVVEAAARGKSLTEALEATNAFPVSFLDAVDVGERSGRLVESMGHLAEQYRLEAQRRMTMMATVGGFTVVAVVLIFMVGMILLVASRTVIPYYGEVNSLLDEIHGQR